MKKILCILMIALMLMGICSITASAEVATEISNEAVNWLFYQEFENAYIDLIDGNGPVVGFYEELYYHYSADCSVEWVLIYGHLTIGPPWTMKPCAVLEDRVIRFDMQDYSPFYANYGLYIVDEQEFIDIVYALNDDAYHDEIYNFLNEHNIGELIGDMDNDRKLTIKDATYIQKCIAEIIEFPENDAVCITGDYEGSNKYLAYLSDFNRDGERNVKDATAIQKYIAGITE